LRQVCGAYLELYRWIMNLEIANYVKTAQARRQGKGSEARCRQGRHGGHYWHEPGFVCLPHEAALAFESSLGGGSAWRTAHCLMVRSRVRRMHVIDW